MKPKLFLLIMLLICFTSGCIRKTELDELAFFSGAGIDQLEDGKIQLIFQVILHRELKIQAQSGNLPSNNVISEGKSLSDADNNFSLQSGRRGLWSHAKIIVIGENLAKNGLDDLLDFLQRNYEVLGRTHLIVAKGDARPILDAETTNLETIQSFNISDMLDQYKTNGQTFPVDLNDYLLRASEGIGSNFLPGIKQLEQSKKSQSEEKSKSTNALELSETAIFKDNKLIGWFDQVETTGLLFIHSKLQSTVLEIEYPNKGQQAYITLEHAKSKLSPVYENGQLKKIIITIKANGNLVEGHTVIDASKPSILEDLGKKAATEIESIINKSIDKGQTLHADVFDISSIVHSSNPKLWEGIKPSWDEIFSTLEFEVKAKVTIERSGLVTKSIK